jgi:hypothetical protein
MIVFPMGSTTKGPGYPFIPIDTQRIKKSKNPFTNILLGRGLSYPPVLVKRNLLCHIRLELRAFSKSRLQKLREYDYNGWACSPEITSPFSDLQKISVTFLSPDWPSPS